MEDRRQFNRLVHTYIEYYERDANINEASRVVEALCYMTGKNFGDMPKYSWYNNITLWYDAVSNWLVRENILAQ